jgi:hypothetical protein
MFKKPYIIVSVVIVIVAGSLLWRYVANHKKQANEDSAKQEQPKSILTPAINGVLVDPIVAKRRPIAVVIENHPDSRPQTGLDKADVVYETLAEGGITRFLAVYQAAEVSAIGPVRSARDYFAELATEYAAVFAHVGGSDEALANLSADKYDGLNDANQYFLDKYFKRVTNRYAPHNVYTSLDSLRGLITDKHWKSTTSVPVWQFGDATTAGTQPATEATVTFSTASYTARFVYDPVTGLYNRFLAGKAHADAETKAQLTAKTVVVQLATVTDTPNDPKLRVDIDLNSGGHAYIFHHGVVTHASWGKRNGRTRYFDVDGKEIVFERGKIWVAIAPNVQHTITWK